MRYTENNRKFFLQSAEVLAPLLLGKLLCKKFPDGAVRKLRITETEAYCEQDSASHSFGGMTKSNHSMFMTGGTAYVFNCHGWQFNIICNSSGVGEGVLIRGAGDYDGPVKLTKALDIVPLLSPPFRFSGKKKPPSTTSTAHFLPSVYIITENRDFLRNSATTKTLKTQQAVTLENQRCLRYNKIYNTYANRTF